MREFGSLPPSPRQPLYTHTITHTTPEENSNSERPPIFILLRIRDGTTGSLHGLEGHLHIPSFARFWTGTRPSLDSLVQPPAPAVVGALTAQEPDAVLSLTGRAGGSFPGSRGPCRRWQTFSLDKWT